MSVWTSRSRPSSSNEQSMPRATSRLRTTTTPCSLRCSRSLTTRLKRSRLPLRGWAQTTLLFAQTACDLVGLICERNEAPRERALQPLLHLVASEVDEDVL